jgi:glycosyltransferase involved in cell wall biosynthesis
VAIVADLLEERWPSMDLVADMLIMHLGGGVSADVRAAALRPPIVRRLTRLPGLGAGSKSDTADRVVNRFWDYPRWLVGLRDNYDVFHIVDHTYAHLVHVLPEARTIVTCHDTDAFLSLVEPDRSESDLPRMFARRIESGLQKAARVVCPSMATCDDLLRYRILPPERMTVVYNGVHPDYSPRPNEAADRFIDDMIRRADTGVDHTDARPIDLLHVGSTIPRKRIDVLLNAVAAIRQRQPRVRLLKAGSAFTSAQMDLLKSLGLESHIVALPFLDTPQLAALYRRAAAVLVTSEREGFGLPVVEALACGTPVVATDLPVLREVGGGAAKYAALGDVPGWTDAVLGVVQDGMNSRRTTIPANALQQASRFRWDTYAAAMATIYREVAGA